MSAQLYESSTCVSMKEEQTLSVSSFVIFSLIGEFLSSLVSRWRVQIPEDCSETSGRSRWRLSRHQRESWFAQRKGKGRRTKREDGLNERRDRDRRIELTRFATGLDAF